MNIVVTHDQKQGEFVAQFSQRNFKGFGRTADEAISDLLTQAPRFSMSDDRSLYSFEYVDEPQDQPAEQE